MNIILYKTSSEPNKLDKQLSEVTTLSGNLVSMTSIVKPTIEVGYQNNIFTANYAYIPAFNRYYYINDISVDNKVVNISMHCDVLKTYASKIRSSEGRAIRSSSHGNTFIPDTMVTAYDTRRVVTRKLGSGFERSTNYLFTVGG